jgi:hypothetical protein
MLEGIIALARRFIGHSTTNSFLMGALLIASSGLPLPTPPVR